MPNNNQQLGTSVILELDDIVAESIREQQLREKKQKKSDSKSEKKKEDLSISSSSEFFKNAAKSKLRSIITRTDRYKTLQTQINIIKKESKNYPGDKEYVEKLTLLEQTITSYNNVIKNSTSSEAYFANTATLEKNPEMIALDKEHKKIKADIRSKSSGSVYYRIKTYRDILEPIYGMDIRNVVDIQDTIDDVQNNNLKDVDTESTLYKYCKLVVETANQLGISPLELHDMSSAKIYRYIKNSGIEDKKSELEDKEQELNDKKTLLRSKILNDDVSKIIFENFDLTDEVEKSKAMEVIASSKASYVFTMAKHVAKRYGLTEYGDMQDILGEGLLALALYSQRWLDFQQKHPDVPINIDIFLGMSIVHNMAKMAANIKNMGTRGNSAAIWAATKDKRMELSKADLDLFVEMNPDLKELPYDQIKSVYRFSIEDAANENQKIVTESSFHKSLGARIDPDSEIWDSVIKDGEDKFAAADNIDEMVNIMRKMFLLNSKSYNKQQQLAKTNKKYFDEIDFTIFEIIMGTRGDGNITKTTKDGSQISRTLDNYIIDEIESLGYELSQSALNVRKRNINEKLKRISEEYPEMTTSINMFKSYLLSADNIAYGEEYKKSIDKLRKELFDWQHQS